MMKLSVMNKILETVDSEWRSRFVEEEIIKNWKYDNGSVYYYRASSNFLFIFKENGVRRFLRFNDSSERSLKQIQSEINLLTYLKRKSIDVAVPVLSHHGNFVEEIVTSKGTFYGVVFEALPGEHKEMNELTEDDYVKWGEALGKLHSSFQTVPDSIKVERHSWRDQLVFVEHTLLEDDDAATKELHFLNETLTKLQTNEESSGLIHYDFELDNLCWSEKGISILDFDDSITSFSAADIAYALRDLFVDEVSLEHPDFIAFLRGYSRFKIIDDNQIKLIPVFLRLHHLVQYAKLLHSVDITVSHELSEGFNGLITKLSNKIKEYRNGFEHLTKASL
ncbi:phosphotransferase enzyme family protein [Bacillus sp. AK128]